MENKTVTGTNRTGMDMSPVDIKEMLALTSVTPPSSPGDQKAIAEMRDQYIAEGDAVGSVPMPGTFKGVASTVMQTMTGKSPAGFIDKLGCRLAFERAGVRLYDALIAKVSSAPMDGTKISLDTLWKFRNEELQHFRMLEEAIRSIGADPTAQTPSADVDGVASLGLIQVLTDPRTSVAHCLEAILIAELADNDAWQLLIQLTGKMGMHDLSRDFMRALEEEEVHLAQIRQWFKESALEDAGLS